MCLLNGCRSDDKALNAKGQAYTWKLPATAVAEEVLSHLYVGRFIRFLSACTVSLIMVKVLMSLLF